MADCTNYTCWKIVNWVTAGGKLAEKPCRTCSENQEALRKTPKTEAKDTTRRCV